jgi:hypothetical protein
MELRQTAALLSILLQFFSKEKKKGWLGLPASFASTLAGVQQLASGPFSF